MKQLLFKFLLVPFVFILSGFGQLSIYSYKEKACFPVKNPQSLEYVGDHAMLQQHQVCIIKSASTGTKKGNDKLISSIAEYLEEDDESFSSRKYAGFSNYATLILCALASGLLHPYLRKRLLSSGPSHPYSSNRYILVQVFRI